jgi:hypothetical protein
MEGIQPRPSAPHGENSRLSIPDCKSLVIQATGTVSP